MQALYKFAATCKSHWPSHGYRPWPAKLLLGFLVGALLTAFSPSGYPQTQDWQKQIRKYAEEQDWASALRVVDLEISRAPNDMDVRAWRARILTWSGRLAEAEQEYLKILSISRNDPDNWMGLANVYLREGRTAEALAAMNTAEKLDANRADIHAARARVLRTAGIRNEAQTEFQNAFNLDPSSEEARIGLISLRAEPKHELRFGQENDLFNFADANHNEWTSLTSQWTSRWSTGFAGSFYQRGGVDAGKFVGSVTRRQPKWGALTVGGATGHDNGVIPKTEAFFDLDRGWKAGETTFVRSVETIYGQHWYWYQSSRILTLTTTAIAYLPREWTFSLAATGARSAFSGSGIEWRPSGIARLGFPIATWDLHRLSGNVFFGAGTEDFGQVDQIGSFASQTYGGGLRYQLTARQDLTGYGSYQKRTQNRTDTAFGLSYGIHF
ncbi:MAG TPA: tetratricopeptide repeat protein [Candidatus Acidoferrum sp.]|nr:tetratricopeptide repeat protein [Candidatus Acidoferrum sp.]